MDATRRITTSDLSQTEVIQRAPEAKRFAKVSVTRGTTKQEYNVAGRRSANGARAPKHRQRHAAETWGMGVMGNMNRGAAAP